MVVPAPLLGMFRYPCFDFACDCCDERALACRLPAVFAIFLFAVLRIVFWGVIFFESDDDAFFLAPSAENDDASPHFVHFLREAQVERGAASE